MGKKFKAGDRVESVLNTVVDYRVIEYLGGGWYSVEVKGSPDLRYKARAGILRLSK